MMDYRFIILLIIYGSFSCIWYFCLGGVYVIVLWDVGVGVFYVVVFVFDFCFILLFIVFMFNIIGEYIY